MSVIRLTTILIPSNDFAGKSVEAGNVVVVTTRAIAVGRDIGRGVIDEVQAEEPEALAEWLRDPQAAPHGGESVVALIERVATWLDAQMATPAKIVAVTHASVIRAAMVHAIEAGPRSFWRIDVAPLSVTRLSANNGRWTLASLTTIDAESTGP